MNRQRITNTNFRDNKIQKTISQNGGEKGEK